MPAKNDVVSLPVNACNTANAGALVGPKVAAIVCAAMYLQCFPTANDIQTSRAIGMIASLDRMTTTTSVSYVLILIFS